MSADSRNLLKGKQSPSGGSKKRCAGLHLSLWIHVAGAELPSVRGQPPQTFFEVDFLAGASFETFAIHTFASTQAAIVLWLCTVPKSLSGQLVPPGRQ